MFRQVAFQCCLFLAFSLQAQQRVPGQVIVQLRPADTDIRAVLADLNARQPSPAQLRLGRSIGHDWGLYVLNFNELEERADSVLARLRKHQAIGMAQLDRLARERTEPNDSLWSRQGDMRQIGADLVWNLTSGGLTPQGDTIVVAILEQWCPREHPDLKPNLWVNWAEIPQNGLDDDGNGYADDRLGFNALQGFGDDWAYDIAVASGVNINHAPGVTGIIGACGNNKRGIAGVNWHLKLLNIAVPGLSESTILEGYGYVCEQRKLYNQSGGKKGAFIVATNASFGIDQGSPDDYPLWCAVYDSLGKAGVLSCVATANSDWDIDSVGDVPSACASHFIISVNNVNQSDQRQPSGYSPTHIDLAAPGSGTFSTGVADKYANIGGCSAATPHVTGGVALLYSLGCDSLTTDARSNPPVCALRMRDLLLANVLPLPELDGRCVTGGRLDLDAAAQAAIDGCGQPSTAAGDIWLSPNPSPGPLQVHYRSPGIEPMRVRAFDIAGKLMLETVLPAHPFGEEIERLDIEAWAAGVYFLVFEGHAAFRFVKT